MLTRKGLQATDGQSSAPPRRAAEWQDGGHQGWTVFEIPSSPGSSHPSDRSSAVKIRCVATGVIAPICSVGQRKAADHGASETTPVPMQPHALVPPASTGCELLLPSMACRAARACATHATLLQLNRTFPINGSAAVCRTETRLCLALLAR